MSNDTIGLTLHAETSAQIIEDDSLKIASMLKCIFKKPGFVSINKDSNVSFIDMVTLCGPDHNKLSNMLLEALSKICTKLLPDTGAEVSVDIKEADELDSFTVIINIKNNAGMDVVKSADVENVNGIFKVIYT